MKKIAKRLISLACVAALATTCAVGASAKSYSGKLAGTYNWTASNSSLGLYGSFRATTNGHGWSALDGERRVRANYTSPSGSGSDGWIYAPDRNPVASYDCIHTPSITGQNSDHYVAAYGYSDSYYRLLL